MNLSTAEEVEKEACHCGRSAAALGMCHTHYMVQYRAKRDPSRRAIPRTKEPKYITVHQRLGKAAVHACVDCGEGANEWTLSREPVGPVRKGFHGRRPVVWSFDPADYAPRCWSCHAIHDNRARNFGRS